MGIPLYFRFLTKKYPDIIRELKAHPCHILYFDLNGLIHPCCSKARTQLLGDGKDIGKVTRQELDVAMFREIQKQIEFIVAKAQPRDRVVLSVDGVAPMAKLSQQRTRRYKSHILRTMTNRIRTKYGEMPDPWDTNAISPGTEFMTTLMAKLEAYVEAYNSSRETDVTPLFELSSCEHPGEGEHKIFHEIRNAAIEDPEPIRYIYGLDADLIMLSLASNRNNIRLLRESVHFGKVKHDDLLLLEVDELREALCREIRGHLEVTNSLDNGELVQDYLVLCFLLGNDFLPHLPSLHIREGSVDFLLECYAKTLNEQPVRQTLVSHDTQSPEINLHILARCLELVAQEEDNMAKAFHVSYSKQRYHAMHKLTPLEEEIRKVEHLPITRPTRNTIRFDQEGWGQRYYARHLGLERTIDPYDLANMCRSFHTGLVWTLKYYTEGVPSWTWTYPYRIAPTALDLHRYFQSTASQKAIHFAPSEAATPQAQLLCILPPSSVSLLDKPYRKLMTDVDSPIRDLYPNSFQMEMIYCRFFHEAMPLLPVVDTQRVRAAIAQIT